MDREKFLPFVTIAVCCVVTFFFAEIIYQPIKSKIFSMQTETQKLHAAEIEIANFENLHGSFENFSTITETKLETAREFLPAESLQDNFAAEIYKVAEKNKILVNSIQIGEVENVEENFSRQSIKIKIDGDYISTLNFMREIIDGERFAAIENLTLESHENILNGDIEILIFSVAAPS